MPLPALCNSWARHCLVREAESRHLVEAVTTAGWARGNACQQLSPRTAISLCLEHIPGPASAAHGPVSTARGCWSFLLGSEAIPTLAPTSFQFNNQILT